ncbi:MAG: tetratricopeptide repeat protein [Candidatus Marinimicrobia bacterium]|nr:tetratricopeptide repeat protein [Candidatus Neomarinimicrobiota bacterium]
MNELRAQLSATNVQTTGTTYEDALASFYNKDYQRGISQFKSLVNTTSTELRDNSQYWIGECYYGLKQYRQALNAFEKVFNFKGTDKYDDAQLKLGYCYKQLNDNSRAVAEFERLIQYYPESEYRNIALNQISILD